MGHSSRQPDPSASQLACRLRMTAATHTADALIDHKPHGIGPTFLADVPDCSANLELAREPRVL
jgi:hypothetical protein